MSVMNIGHAWPIVGREEELRLIGEAIRRASSGAVVISGAAGVGKSRLLEEALRRAAAEGLFTKLTRATSAAASIPFGAFSSLTPTLAGQGVGRIGVIRQAAAALIAAASGRRFVLGVDDAHLLDDSSATLVHHLADTGTAFVIAGVRSAERPPDAVTKLWKDGLGERLDLQPLSRTQTAELLEAVLDGPADGGTHQRIWKATEGNPLYLRELILGATEAESLALADGVWRWTGQVAVAPRLVDLLDERLAALSVREREALELVAVAEPIELELLGSILAEDALLSTERHGLLDTREEGKQLIVRLSHPLYGELLRAQIPAGGRAIKRRLADALESQAAHCRDDLLRLATWRLESGSADEPKMLLGASCLAAAGFDFALAGRLARAALDAGGGAEARQCLSVALIGRGSYRDADAQLAAAESESQIEARRVEIAIARANNLYWHLGQATAAVEVLAAAEYAPEVEGMRRSLTAARAGLLLFEGDTQQSVNLALELLDRTGFADAAAWQAAMTAGWGSACAGRIGASLQLLDRFIDRAAWHPEDCPPFALFWLRTARFVALCFAGRFEEGLTAGREAYDEAVEMRAEIGRTMHSFGLGWGVQLQGDAESSARWLREAVRDLREVDMFRQLSSALGELAQAEALLGNMAAAESALADAQAARVDSFRMDEWAVGLARAWVEAARGETAGAAATAIETAQVTGSLGQHFLEAIALHDALRLGSTDVVDRLVELSEEIDGSLVDVFAEHAIALRTGEVRGLEKVSESFERLGAFLYAAEAAAEASGAFGQDGRAASARRAAARAEDLRARCGPVSTPALASLRAPSMSRREREVATLAAGGLSNREIARRLVVSVRTVENHLHNAYIKLDVRAREELGSLFSRN